MIGMVFQKPNPFPMMSVYDNVIAGYKLGRKTNKSDMDTIVERSLRQAALWDEVKDKLHESGYIALRRAAAAAVHRAHARRRAEVVLMDEPCSALDPIATLKIEDLMQSLRDQYTIVIVTHNMQQAARVSDQTAYMLAGEERVGELIEMGPTKQIFTNPKDKRTEDYITGRFG